MPLCKKVPGGIRRGTQCSMSYKHLLNWTFNCKHNRQLIIKFKFEKLISRRRCVINHDSRAREKFHFLPTVYRVLGRTQKIQRMSRKKQPPVMSRTDDLRSSDSGLFVTESPPPGARPNATDARSPSRCYCCKSANCCLSSARKQAGKQV